MYPVRLSHGEPDTFIRFVNLHPSHHSARLGAGQLTPLSRLFIQAQSQRSLTAILKQKP